MLEPEAVVRLMWAALNDRDYGTLAGSISEDCDWLSIPAGQHYRGPRAMTDGLRRFDDDFPDGRGEILRLVAEGDLVVVEWRMRGTHRETGRSFSRRGCSVAEVRGGKIVAYRDYFDRQSLAEQLA